MPRTKKLPLITRLIAACTLALGAIAMLWSLESEAVVAGGAPGGAALTVSPDTGLGNGDVVHVTGSGFDPTQAVSVAECSDAAGQPSIAVGAMTFDVSCGVPVALVVGPGNREVGASVAVSISAGITGPPVGGTDSDGTGAAADAAGFPCPPTAAQAAAGAQCSIVARDAAGVVASATLSFGAPNQSAPQDAATTTSEVPVEVTTTTTTTAPSTTTTRPVAVTAPTASTSTTTAATRPMLAPAEAAAAPSGPHLVATPSTGLNGGSLVTVTGSGFDANSFGGLSECSAVSAQPSVSVGGRALPVSCTNPLKVAVTTDRHGSFTASPFSVVVGVPGPPASGTDNRGGSATSDAAAFPCPPTPAQVVAGNLCEITFFDAAGTATSTSIAFVASPSPAPAAGPAVHASAPGTPSSTTPATSGPSGNGTLAQTGINVVRLVASGALMIVSGVVLAAPRRSRRPRPRHARV